MFQTKLNVDLTYMHMISTRLERFKRVRKDVFNCRCPVCLDSMKKKSKARFYFYVKQGSLNVMCQNCGYSRSFFNFVTEHFSDIANEYRKETLLNSFKAHEKQTNTTTQEINNNPPESKIIALQSGLFGCTNINLLPSTHKARQYLESRNFTSEMMDRLFYTDNFKLVASQLNKESSENLLDKEPRIVIPFYDTSNNIELIQGRSLDKESNMRYITIKTSDDVDKIYGKNVVDYNKTVYCVEGPIDSMFVDNCLAACDGNLTRVKQANVYVWDNQPRNKDVIRYMEEAIQRGLSIVIWPNSPTNKQDINDMIKTGVSQKMLMTVIRNRTFSGIKAKLELSRWKRI